MFKRIIISLFFITSIFLCLKGQNINKPNIPGPAGLKVNSWSGELFYQRTDLFIPGKGPSIDLTFSYNSFTTV